MILLEDGRADPSYNDIIKALLDDYRADPCTNMSYAVNLFMWDGRTSYTLTMLDALQ